MSHTDRKFTDYKHSPGLRNVGSYQSSGHPYVTGSAMGSSGDSIEVRVAFPFVTKTVTVIASGTTQDPRIGITFNSTGTDPGIMGGNHIITMDSSGDSMTFDVKCKEMFIHNVKGNTTSGFEVFASLTNIDVGHMYDLTGSGLSHWSAAH